MVNKSFLLSACIVISLLTSSVFAQQYSYNYEEMSMDEYSAELANWTKREADAVAEIAKCETEIASLNERIDAAQNEYDGLWSDIYNKLGTDKAGYDSFVNQCKALESDVSGLLSLSPENIYSRRSELDGYEKQLAELRADKRSLGLEPYDTLARVENLISQARSKMKPTHGSYTVARGDYLWKISRKQDIYGDAYQWIKIYTANRTQITNPDLIYPNQVFRIPRMAEANEHWVARGESLTSIASRYGSPFTWQRIYEANKDVISQAELIYPHMILNLPR